MSAEQMHELVRQFIEKSNLKVSSDRTKLVVSRLVKMNKPTTARVIQVIKPKKWSLGRKQTNAIDFGREEETLKEIVERLKKVKKGK